jgi:hypothetical protein
MYLLLLPVDTSIRLPLWALVIRYSVWRDGIAKEKKETKEKRPKKKKRRLAHDEEGNIESSLLTRRDWHPGIYDRYGDGHGDGDLACPQRGLNVTVH